MNVSGADDQMLLPIRTRVRVIGGSDEILIIVAYFPMVGRPKEMYVVRPLTGGIENKVPIDQVVKVEL